MARTTIAVTELPGPYAVSATSVTWTNADTTNGMQFQATGREVLLVRNTNTTASQSFTVVSVPDSFGRTGDLVHSVPASGLVTTQVFPLLGWAQSDGYIYVDTTGADLQFAVIRLK